MEYILVLEDTDIKQLVSDAMTFGFDRAGYKVVLASDPRSKNAPRVDVEITSLWMWVTIINDRSRKQFHFNIETVVTSNARELANIGVVKAYGFRNGSYDKNWKSYSNTALHTLKFFIDDFRDNVAASVAAN